MRNRHLFIAAAFVAVSTFLFVWASQSPGFMSKTDMNAIRTASLSVDEYGIDPASFLITEALVERNETFSDLLSPYNVDYERIVTLARDGRDVFDVRRLKTHRPYRIYTDSTGLARYMVYEKDRWSYVVFDLGESPSIVLKEREVSVRIRNVSGVIENSLYVTLVSHNIHPVVATRMSEVFAWQVDFYRIQKGDAFRIIFEEEYVGGQSVGVGQILAARFVHLGNDYFAFHFKNKGVDEHFDEEGKSLRKAFLMAPVDFSRISSSFSNRRFHPVQKRFKAHLGTDYAAAKGTPIRATGEGIVSDASYGRFNGNYVKIRHNGTYSTQYLHMSRIASGIRSGVRVKQGQVIGYVGSTGLATGNHVCYRFWKNGKQVNHRREKFPSVGPLPRKYQSEFLLLKDSYLAQLRRPIRSTDESGFIVLEEHAAIAAP